MEHIVKYFQGERNESILFLVAGVISIMAAFYIIFVLKSVFWNGFAIPLVVVASLELMVGFVIYNRSPRDIARVQHYMERDQSKIASVEIPRMEKVMSNFRLFRYLELGLILVGFILMYYAKPELFWQGMGLGLFSQSAIVLMMDFFAESRGLKYLDYLKNLVTTI